MERSPSQMLSKLKSTGNMSVLKSFIPEVNIVIVNQEMPEGIHE
jgi:hypothetical protein